MLVFQGTENRRKNFSTHSGYSSSNTQSAFGEKTSYGTGGLFTHHWDNSFSTQSAFGAETSRLDRLLSSLNIVNVPEDGSCLFWAAGLAYLLSISEDQFEQACVKLFGEEWSIDLVKKMVQDAKLSKLPTTQKDSLDSPFFSLIQSFRLQVVRHMRKTLPPDASIEGISLYNHLEKMQNNIEWGGREEIQAISGLLGCKISVINSWDKNLKYIERFGAGPTQLYLYLEGDHYFIGLQKEDVPKRTEKLTSSVVTKNSSFRNEKNNNNFNQANLSNNLSGIAWAKNLKNVFNTRSQKLPDNAKANNLASPLLQKQTAEEEQRVLRMLKQLRLLEVEELLEELNILTEIEELEEEIEKNNKMNMLAPFQFLHPLNFLTPFSRLKKFTNWLNATGPSKLSMLEEEKVKKLNEVKKINKGIVLLRKLIERKEKALFSTEEEIKKPEDLVKIEKQMSELKNSINATCIAKNKQIAYRITEQNKRLKNSLFFLDEKREEYIAIQNSKKKNRVKRKKKKIILSEIKNFKDILDESIESPISMLKQEIALQKSYLGLQNLISCNVRLSDETILDEDLNFLYLQSKWKEREERIRYFAELPFIEGVSDEDLPEDYSKVKELSGKIITISSLGGLLVMYFYGAYRDYNDMVAARQGREQRR